jgi:multicomponent Na+:H+ antiporter subunit G
MRDAVIALLLLAGSGLMLLAAVAIVRFPDLYARMQGSTKASTLGIVFLALAASLHFGDLAVSARAAAIVIFVFLTAPVAAHVMGRAAHIIGVRAWEGTLFDDLRRDSLASSAENPGIEDG